MNAARTPIPDPATGDWHLDKRIPLALIFALLAQTAGLVWWVSGVVNRLDNAVDANSRQDVRIAAMETSSNAQAVSNAKITEQVLAMRESIAEIKSSQAETNRLLRNLSNLAAE